MKALHSSRSPWFVGNALLALLFALFGVGTLIEQQWAMGAALLCISAALFLLGNAQQRWNAIPRWRMGLAALLVLAGGIIFGVFALPLYLR